MTFSIRMELQVNRKDPSYPFSILLYSHQEEIDAEETLYKSGQNELATNLLFMGARTCLILNPLNFDPNPQIAPLTQGPMSVQAHLLALSLDPVINDVMIKILFFKGEYNQNKPFFNNISSAQWKAAVEQGWNANYTFLNTLFANKLISAKGYNSVVGSSPSLQLLALRASSRKQRNSLPQNLINRLNNRALQK